MIVTIDVSADDIARGAVEDCRTCPVALALRRQLPEIEPYQWSVGDEFASVCFGDSGVTMTVDLPEDAQAFIDQFDAMMHVAPFTFQFLLPPNAHKFVQVPS